MVFLGTVLEKDMTLPSVKARIRVDSTIFGDSSIKSVLMVRPVQIHLFELNEQRLLFILRIHGKDEVKHEITTEYLESWTFPIRNGRVGPIELTGESEYQDFGEFVRKIQTIQKSLHQ